jgi:response regulator RpfG family c-di-GMP phosphodiesterase
MSKLAANMPRVLCVDDEPQVLEGMRDRLHRSFDVRVAGGGIEGLRALQAEPDAYAIVISDMRMPGMAGDVFLREARNLAPHAVRMLLTGQADVEAAIRAVNHAQLFRFLTKPCEGEELLRACAAALAHHRLLSAERVLLEQTLRGAVEALSRILALATPVAFGRSERIKKLTGQVAEAAGLKDRWELEVAATLTYVGAVTLPRETAERWYTGALLSGDEELMVARMPRLGQELLEGIPRLEGVRKILTDYKTTPEAGNPLSIASIPEPARILRLVVDYDKLATHEDSDVVIGLMRERRIYDPFLLNQLAEILGIESRSTGASREIPLDHLEVGMTLADDVHRTAGGLLIARGQVVNDQLLEHLANLPANSVKEPIYVYSKDEEWR